jgi:methyltransferase (TIGR00027 family)
MLPGPHIRLPLLFSVFANGFVLMTLLTARATVYLARDWYFGNLVPADAAELCTRFLQTGSAREPRYLKYFDRPACRQLIGAVEYLTVPGFSLQVAARKRAIEDYVRAAIAAGAQQVVMLEPGFDTLAIRLHREFPAIQFFELDRPSSQSIKRQALSAQWTPGANLHFIAGDGAHSALTDNVLRVRGFQLNMPTVFVLEGVVARLTRDERDSAFRAMNELGGRGSQIVFTYIEREVDGRIHYRGATWMARMWASAQSSRLRWGPRRDELRSYLSGLGLALRESLAADQFRARYLDGDRDVPLAEGEVVALADTVRGL